MKILAIESSCDETAAAVVEDGRKILSNIVDSQVETHALYGGVVPEIASRRHMEAVVRVTDCALQTAGMQADEVDALRDCAPEFCCLGDCVAPRNILAATQEAEQMMLDIGRG